MTPALLALGFALAARLEDPVARGAALVAQAGNNWLTNKACFSCHHQTLPMFALVEAKAAPSAWMQRQADFTHTFFQKNVESMNARRHLGGGAFTAGYGLWALRLAEHPASETTAAIVGYLLDIQGIAAPDGKPPRHEGPWVASCVRPPSQSSPVSATVMVLAGMKHYATDAQKPQVAAAEKSAQAWLANAPLKSTEDLAWRAWGLHRLGGDDVAKSKARAALVAAQKDDGGWPQEPGMASDAYATGQALFALRQTGTPRADVAAVRAAAFLKRTQYADGSWRVETRAKPVQRDFDNGDPHEKHQFLSVAATSWATAALAQMR